MMTRKDYVATAEILSNYFATSVFDEQGEMLFADLVDEFSNDLNVNPNTPPSFLVHSADDKAVPIANSLLFYDALIKNGVSISMNPFSCK